jgi:hypothetical protein
LRRKEIGRGATAEITVDNKLVTNR